MKIDFPPLVCATFQKRKNRFIAEMDIQGERQEVHVPSTGRLDTLLLPGAPCYLKPSGNPRRKTPYSLFLVQKDGIWVCIDALIANAFAERLLSAGEIPGIPPGTFRREVQVGNSRLDFLLTDAHGFQHLIEVKSVNLAQDGCALFPDAPTERGVRHLQELYHLQIQGYRTHVLFVVQREDAVRFSPHQKIDPAFSEWLFRCSKAGSNIQACLTKVTREQIALLDWIPVRF